MKRVYLDNAATTQIDVSVLEAMIPVLQEQFGNPSSIHAEGRRARALLENARKTVARCIQASSAEIFFTSGGTESNNMAIKCAVRDLGVEKIISSPMEHHCGLHTIERMHKVNHTEVTLLRPRADGHFDLQMLENELKLSAGKKVLVSLMHGNNEIGTLLDLPTVSEICQKYGALLHCDTVQTMGHFPFDMNQLKVSFLSGSAHKFHGPKGVGFIYINAENPIQPFIDGGSQERNMRGGTENIYGIVGLAKALELACADIENRRNHILDIKNYLKTQLLEHIEGVEFNGTPDGPSLYHVLSVSFPPSPKNELLLLSLDIAGVACSGGSACTSGSEKGSHVLEAIGAPAERKSIRFSFSHHNTREEIDFVVAQLKNIF